MPQLPAKTFTDALSKVLKVIKAPNSYSRYTLRFISTGESIKIIGQSTGDAIAIAEYPHDCEAFDSAVYIQKDHDLFKMSKGLKKEDLISIDVTNDFINFKVKFFDFKIENLSLENEDFYHPPETPPDGSWLLSSSTLKKHIQIVCDTASTELTKQILTGVNVAKFSESLIFAATDGHRLSAYTPNYQITPESLVNKGESLGTFNSKALRQFITLLGKNQHLTISKKGEYLFLKSQDLTCILKEIEGAYPNYPQLCQRVFDSLTDEYGVVHDYIPMTINGLIHDEFINAVKHYGSLSGGRYNVVVLTTDGEEVNLHTRPMYADEEQLTFKTNFKSDSNNPWKIGLNSKYLGFIIGALKGEEVDISFYETNPMKPKNPIHINMGDLFHLLMPVDLGEK